MLNPSARRGTSSLFLFVACVLLQEERLLAEPPPLLVPNGKQFSEPTASSAVESIHQTTLSGLIREIVIEAADDEVVDKKHWNKEAERFDGLKVRGLKISKRKKTVPHGFCRRYKAHLVKPDETFSLEIEQQESSPSDDAIRFLISTRLMVRSEATFAHYVYGVKGVNGTAIADAVVRAQVVLTISPQASFDWSSPLPKLHLNAEVKRVDLDLEKFRLQKLGPLGGDFAKVLGQGSREIVAALIDSQERQLHRKLQKKLDEVQGDPSRKDGAATKRES
ncbi:hypothetical protein AB1L42_18275 [Thalassoglobus sp. JC818]|uniref:hypothetical protein n=1 Tax=Thalassoglobus sp. JC818 TaxID=3232136 RepID=UPI003459D8B8